MSTTQSTEREWRAEPDGGEFGAESLTSDTGWVCGEYSFAYSYDDGRPGTFFEVYTRLCERTKVYTKTQSCTGATEERTETDTRTDVDERNVA